jgi:hypothetical protein
VPHAEFRMSRVDEGGDEQRVADPRRAGKTEQTGGSGTGTPGSANVAGQVDASSHGHDERTASGGGDSDG